jgi:hypothetical protein
MKTILFVIALAPLGLAWVGEKFSAGQMTAELIRLRQQRAELASLRHERDRLSQRLNEAEKRAAISAEQTAAATPASPAESEDWSRATLALGDWADVKGCRFRGQATPQASIESALWAAAGGDVATLKQLLFVSEETRAAAAALWASLPASARMAYQGPDDLISALTVKRIPLGEAQLVWLNQAGPDHATACVFINGPPNPGSASDPASASQDEAPKAPPGTPEKRPAVAYLALQREGDRWCLVVPPAAVGMLAKDLIAPIKSGR